jgi:hypothetical protein
MRRAGTLISPTWQHVSRDEKSLPKPPLRSPIPRSGVVASPTGPTDPCYPTLPQVHSHSAMSPPPHNLCVGGGRERDIQYGKYTLTKYIPNSPPLSFYYPSSTSKPLHLSFHVHSPKHIPTFPFVHLYFLSSTFQPFHCFLIQLQ